MRYYNVDYEQGNENTEDFLSSREEKKIFDESSKNMLDNKLDLSNKQIDHKVFYLYHHFCFRHFSIFRSLIFEFYK